jgi:hypothetical protein
MGSQEAKEQGDGGRLARAVWPEEGESLASSDLDVEVVQREVPTVTAHDPVKPKSRVSTERFRIWRTDVAQ